MHNAFLNISGVRRWLKVGDFLTFKKRTWKRDGHLSLSLCFSSS
jgi:hypothetical protein